MSETLSITPKILELNEEETNDIFMTLTMCVLTNGVNLNNLQFTDDYINGIVENKDKYIGIPLVVNRLKLENGLYNNLTHEFNKKTGELNTDCVGSFVDFWSETDSDGALQLMGNVRVFKRYPNVCNAFIELYESGDLEFSCEVIAYGYESNDENTKVRTLSYMYNSQVNALLGSCAVSYPAEPKSRASLLVSEALEKDLKGGDSLSEESKTEVFNKGIDIKYHTDVETSSLKWNEVSSQIYGILNPIDLKLNYRKYNFYIRDLYNDYVLVEEYDDYDVLWKIGYQIVNDSVVLDEKEKWVKGKLGFIPDGVQISTLLAEKATLSAEINTKINELNNQHKEVTEVMEEQVKELQEKIDSLTKQIDELNGLVVSQKEEIVQHQNKETELNSTIETLTPFKEQVETAEKQAKKDALTEKFNKILSEESMKSEQVVNAIESLDEVSLNAIVVSEVTKEKATKTEVKVKDVIVSAKQPEDLIPQGLREKLYTPKSE